MAITCKPLLALSLVLASAAGAQTATDYDSVGLDARGAEIRGIVECRADLALSFPVSGVVEDTLVVEGQTVEAGEVLMRLDQEIESIEVERRRTLWQSRADLDAAEARVAVGEQQLSAGQTVYDAARGISLEDLQNRKLSYDLAVSELARLETQKQIEELDFHTAEESLRRRTLAAVAPGIVSRIIRRTGESAQAMDPVLQLCDTGALFFVANLSIRRASELQAGQSVILRASGRDENLNGEVSFVSPVVDPGSGLRRVKVHLTDPPDWLSPGTGAVLTTPQG
ncbi:RND family efflux transporter, MFP subunit [Poseidonocella pacifica]|uniref:RND family efflux transporter, MFP subunit n=1 Tax=Poseidonocella pacifica TaxID=871651 RepID=A0A1I0YFF7_9RHOB|nr:HlyD family efflux transporter periplasmic adaptor subunit [Poseidonocella pacifica]SFB11240.1 RND family efflux transporter, MFP subunit [Poseidonocella pacifica]